MAGSISHRQLRCFRMLYLSLFRADILPVILPRYSPKKVTMRNTQTGALMRSIQGLPNSFFIRSLKAADWYTSPSLRKYFLPFIP